MAVTNYSKKCTSCGGNKWEYKKEMKLWVCRYCGNQVERKEEYDGLYTIKNVVRQVIMDSAYRRLEQADRNLSECQKISSRYEGTLVAGICFRLIAAVSGYNGQDPRAMLGQLRRDYEELTAQGNELGDDETALYEFLDNSDAWAALATVFDTLGDAKRREYLLTLMDARQVFSKETNKSLLRFALKNERGELVDRILENEENVDVKDAFRAILESCPDSERKGRLAAKLLAAGAVTEDEKQVVEEYLTGEDSVATKAAVVLAACKVPLQLSLDILMREVLSRVEPQALQLLLGALFTRRLFDAEIEALTDFAAAQKCGEGCLAVLDAMTASGQFLPLSVRQAQNFVENKELTPQAREQILQKLDGFSASGRMWESVAGHYLCCADEDAQNRNAVLEMLLKRTECVPAKDLEQYVLAVTYDGQQKPDVIGRIFELPEMKPGFFRELAGKYLRSGADEESLRPAVLHRLLSCGLSIDSAVLIDYVCWAEGDCGSKVELVQMALKNGTMLRSDALSLYLERCADSFEPQMFSLLGQGSFTVSDKAMENYVMRCKDEPAVKAANAMELAKHMSKKLGSTPCTVVHAGTRISCTLAQAYLLTTADEIGLAQRMVSAMASCGTKLSTDITADGRNVRFGRYLNEKKGQLSPVTGQLAEEHKLFGFSLFG